MNRIRRWFARLTGPPGTVRVQASQLTRPAASLPGRSGLNGFAGRFIQDVAASASVAAGHQFGRRSRAARPADGRRRPATTATMSRRRTITALCPLPHTVQLCIHCQQRPAGFWVTPIGGATARRPWCLTCCQDLDPSRCHTVPFDAHQGEAISVNATDVTPADPATAHGGSSAGDNAASSPPAPGGGQVWLGSGELAHHRAIPLAAAWPQAGYCTGAGPVPKPGNGQLLPGGSDGNDRRA